MMSYEDELDAEQVDALRQEYDDSYGTSVMGPDTAPKSGEFYKPMNPDTQVPGRPVDDPAPSEPEPGEMPSEPQPMEMPPDPGPPSWNPPAEPLKLPESPPELERDPNLPDTERLPDMQPETPEAPQTPESPQTPEAPEIEPEIEPAPDTLPSAGNEPPVEVGEEALEGGETLAEGGELAEGGAALGELAPVAAAGIAGYELGSAIAPYVYGDKNLDGSPVTKMENVDDIDTDYKNSLAYKVNSWLDD